MLGVQAPELQVFPFDEWRDNRRYFVENHWSVLFGTGNLEHEKENPLGF